MKIFQKTKTRIAERPTAKPHSTEPVAQSLNDDELEAVAGGTQWINRDRFILSAGHGDVEIGLLLPAVQK